MEEGERSPLLSQVSNDCQDWGCSLSDPTQSPTVYWGGGCPAAKIGVVLY